VATIASAYLNAAHVQPVGPTRVVRGDARFAAGAVPFAVLASVHLLVLLLLRLLALPAVEDSAVPAAEPGHTAPKVGQPAPAVAPPQDSQSRQDDLLVRRVMVRRLLAGETHDKPVSWQDVQAATGLSRSRSYALLRQERETLTRTNGQPRT
jgi:hypothetical protein